MWYIDEIEYYLIFKKNEDLFLDILMFLGL